MAEDHDGVVHEGEGEAVVADPSGILQLDEFGFLIDPSSPESGLIGTQISGLDVWSAYQTAVYIARAGGSWARFTPDLAVSYSYGVGATLPDGYEPFSALESQLGAQRAMALYADVANVTFTEAADPADAQITYMHEIGSTNGGGWANYPDAAGVHVNVGHVSWETTMEPGTYALRLLLHELGHAMGLAHPGEYNGDSATYGDVDHFNDSYQYTNMSYWSETNTGAEFSNFATLALHDMLAVQLEYGANWSTRASDTSYGWNATAGLDSYDFSHDSSMGFAIWDGGGVDVLDFSGFSGGTVLDLRQGGFSSTGLEVYSVAIAYGAVIENGIGGQGDDRMRGNGTGNRLEGGRGADSIYGGAEADAVASPDPRAFTGIALNHDVQVFDQYLGRAGVTAFSGAAFTVEMLVDLIRTPGDTIPFVSYNVSGNDNQVLLEGRTGGYLQLTLDNKTAYVTDYATENLVDGRAHRLSLSWDKASGTVTIHVDGVQVHQGIHITAIGATVDQGGVLVIGQEQDALGAGFSAAQVLQGTVGDIRIFDHVRDTAQIAAAAFGTVAADSAGLIHNWQAQAGDAASVRDLAQWQPPVDLTSLLPSGFFTASASSIYDSNSGAIRVLDDNAETFNHTLNSGAEWLRLDFAQALSLTHVNLVNRPTWGSRLDGATVSVLDASGDVIFTSAPISGAGSGATITIALPAGLEAHGLRIDQTTNFLHLAEVNLFGTAPAGVEVPTDLLATDLVIHGGAVAGRVETVIDTTPDADTLIGGLGDDVLHGGAGHDLLLGHGGEDATIAALHGILLNDGAVTNQYLGTSGYAGLGGAAGAVQFTIEFAFQITAMPGTEIDFFTYANAQTANALGVGGYKNGTIYVTYRDAEFDTGITTASLNDGDAHRLALAWDGRSDSAGFVLYLDGVAIFSGTHSKQTESLTSGGTLIFGQEQDSLGGGFQSGQIFKGHLGDIRVFDRVLSAAELAAGAITGTDPETGLVSHWQAAADSTTSLTDAQGGAALAISGGAAVSRFGDWDDDRLLGGLGDDTLHGHGGADTLEGGAGADSLDGGSGADSMAGGAGDDLYRVADSGDQVSEAEGDTDTDTDTLADSGGHDQVLASVSYDLDATAGRRFVEDLTLTGADGLSASGNALANRLTGNGGANLLAGLARADTLEGGAGRDTLAGGAGDDLYLVGPADGAGADLLSEALILGQAADAGGYDRVQSLASLSLARGGAQFIESLTLIGVATLNGTGNDLANRLAGNGAANRLSGLGGNDQIAGGAGADTLWGGGGNDAQRGGLGHDRIGGGLGADTLAGGYGDDRMQGDAGHDRIWGEGGNDQLAGQTGDDRIWGGTGKDRLTGGMGADVLTGGAGADQFVFQRGQGADRITDLTGIDRLHLSKGLWAAAGNLSVSDFLDRHAHQTASGTVLKFSALETLRLDHVTLAYLEAHHNLFVLV